MVRRKSATAARAVPTVAPALVTVPRPMLALVLGLVLLLAATLAWREESDVDAGFHLAGGRFIAQHGWPGSDPFTYTQPDAPYVDMNGGWQLMLAGAWGLARETGKNTLVVLLVLASTTVLWMHARQRGVREPGLLAGGFLVALCAWEMRFAARPELVTYLLLAVQLLLLRRHADDGRRAWLWALPVLQLAWTWSHSLSLVGVAVTGAYAAAGLVGARRRDPAPWIALGASAVALFVNPYGWRGVEFLWLLRTRLSAENVFGETIAELRSPFGAGVHGIWPVVAFRVALVLAVALVAARITRRRPFDLLVVALFAVLGATAVRNVGMFAVAVLPIALECAQELSDAWRGLAIPRRVAGVAALALLPLVASQAVLGGYYVSDLRPERFGRGFAPAVAPHGTVDTIEREKLAGPLYNELRFGGYALGRLWPREKVFIDGRLEVVGEAFYRQYQVIESGAGWPEMMRRWNPNLVLIASTTRDLVLRLSEDPAWAPVDFDGASVLFLRRRPENDAALAAAAARIARLNRAASSADAEDQPLATRPDAGFLAAFGRRFYPWEARGRGNACMLLGLNEAARREYRRALVEAGRDEPTIAANYASACLRCGRKDEARTWYGRALELDPENRLARQKLGEISGGR